MIKQISKSTSFQLLFFYTIFIILIAISILNKYALYFNILAILIALFGFHYLTNSEIDIKINKKLQATLFTLAIILIIVIRIIPYINNTIPLGYDAGLYKYGIEHGLENKDLWILTGGMEPGFLYLMKPFTFMLSTDFMLKYLFIFFILLLGFAIYMFSKEFFSDSVAILSLLIYSLSLVQFTVFTYLYYKNIIALSLIFFAFYFLKKEKYTFFVLSGILVGAIHRPSFYIFGLSFFFYTLFNFKHQFKKNILVGIIILAGAFLFYIGDFLPALGILTPVVSSFASPGESPGTFISFSEYQFSILFYLPLAILGLLYMIKNKKFNVFFFYTIILLIIVYFQFFFFNRFIIFLDTALIICAAIGTNIIIKEKGKLAIIIISLLFLSGLLILTQESLSATPGIPNSIFHSINEINIPEQAYIISVSSAFSPYLQGYTNNRIIAPGLFDYDIFHSEQRWVQFWQDNNASELKQYYNEDIYLFTNKDLNTLCYEKTSENLYKWGC